MIVDNVSLSVDDREGNEVERWLKLDLNLDYSMAVFLILETLAA